MFCLNFGAKNPDDERFCSYCGSPLAQENPYANPSTDQLSYGPPNNYYVNFSQPTPQKMKTINPFMIASILEIFVLALVIALFFNVGQKTYSCENAAKNFLQAYANCDWDAVYDNIALTESEFVTREAFMEMYKDVEPISLKELDVQYPDRR